MPITINLTEQNVDSSANKFVYAIATLTFTGNYAAGGDTLDFTTVIDKLMTSLPPVQVTVQSQNGNDRGYIPVQGSGLNNWKLKCFQISGTELPTGAYPAFVTGDVVQISITTRKLL